MSRYAYVPDPLRHGSFTVAEARALGISRRQLQGGPWRRVSYGRYRWVRVDDDEDLRLRAIASELPPGFVFAGLTAARLLGLDLPPGRRPEVIVPPCAIISTRAQAVVRRIRLDPGDVMSRRGLPLTSPLRTCFDLAGRQPLVEGVVALDLALHRGLIEESALRDYVDRHRGVQGVVAARRAIPLVEPKSESPMETRLRLLLVRGGLPQPRAQAEIHDAANQFLGRIDLYYDEARLGIEYDGENHRERLVSDDQRQNRILQTGVRLLRYTATDLRSRPTAVVAEVRAELTRGGPSVYRSTPEARE